RDRRRPGRTARRGGSLLAEDGPHERARKWSADREGPATRRTLGYQNDSALLQAISERRRGPRAPYSDSVSTDRHRFSQADGDNPQQGGRYEITSGAISCFDIIVCWNCQRASAHIGCDYAHRFYGTKSPNRSIPTRKSG